MKPLSLAPAPGLASILLLCLTTVSPWAATPAAFAQSASAKKKVTAETDLPRFSYPLPGSASDFLSVDDATFNAFAAKLLSDADSVLTGYEIEDKATLRKLLSAKLNVQELLGQNQAALATLQSLRDVQEKPEARATAGLLADSVLHARIDSGQSSGAAYEGAFAKHFTAAIDALPWSLAGDTMKTMKTNYELISPSLISGSLKANIDPAALQTKGIDFAGATVLVRSRVTIKVAIPLKAQILSTLTTYIAAHNVQKPDIWQAREVTLTDDQKLTPVLIGIWDSGVDTSLYPKVLYTDPAPGAHSPHGLAFDIHGNLFNGDLQPLTDEQRALYPKILGLSQGLNDLDNGIDSPDAAQARQTLSSTPPAELGPFLKQLSFFGQWMHGTHVAGIAVRGNPAARLVVAQFYDSFPEIPFAPSEEWANKFKADFLELGQYFQSHNVRVVNMSWGDNVAEIEAWLNKTSSEKDPTARKQFAAKIYAIWSDAVKGAIESAPGTLFVCAAGNDNNNASFAGMVPVSLHLPNLIAVGAVDQAGEETSFTSYGDTVIVDADGYQVESFVPGGTRLKESGTSMASPNVVNLAAKLFALQPSLTPQQVIALIKQGAEKSADGRRNLINPKATVALLKQP